MTTPNPVPLPRPAADVVFQRVPDGGVLYAAASEAYFGLNRVGAEAWELLPPVTSTLEELAARLAERHPDVDPAVVRADVAELLNELRQHGLVTDDGSPSTATGDAAGALRHH